MKKRRKICTVWFVLTLLLISQIVPINSNRVARAEQVVMEDGVYTIPVALWNASKDQISMGNASVEQTAKLVVSGGKGTLYIKFQQMTFSGMNGYLSHLNLLENIILNGSQYPTDYTLVPSTVVSTFAVVDQYNSSTSTDSTCAGVLYPKVVCIPLTLGDDLIWANVYVPIMGSLGFGNQLCRIKLDYDKVAVMSEETKSIWNGYETSDTAEEDKNEEEDTVKLDKSSLKEQLETAKNLVTQTDKYTEASLTVLQSAIDEAQKVYDLATTTQIIINGQVTSLKSAIESLIEKSSDSLDKEQLEDGKYTVYVDLWNATANQESMGNPAVNKKALLTVSSGVYTMEISTRPMVIGTITACLQSLQIKQLDGTYQYAKITASNNEGNQPSIFQFTLPSTEEYIDIMIDPKVEVMGDDPLPARLKISWDTLTKVANDQMVEENTDSVVSGVESSAVDITDSVTGIRLQAEANILENGITLSCKQLISGSVYKEVVNLLSDLGNQIQVYKLELLSKAGQSVQPNGMVQISLPIPEGWDEEEVTVYRIQNSTKIKMSGSVSKGKYVFSTNTIATFAMVTSIEDETTSGGGSGSILNGNITSTDSTTESVAEEETDSVEDNNEELNESEQTASNVTVQIIKQQELNHEALLNKMIAVAVLITSMLISFGAVIVVIIVAVKSIRKDK